MSTAHSLKRITRVARSLAVPLLCASISGCGLPRIEAINSASNTRQLSQDTDELLCSRFVKATAPVVAERQQRGLGDCKVFWENHLENQGLGGGGGGAGMIIFIPFIIQDIKEKSDDLQTVSSAACPWFPGKTVSHPGCPTPRSKR